MMYLDTNVVIAYNDKLDPNHDKARKLLENLRDVKVVSKLTLLELASIYSRADLDDPLSLAIYSIDNAGARIVNIDLAKILVEAFKLAPFLKLKTLDLIHIAICRNIGADLFATFNKGIIAKANHIRRIGIEIKY